MKPDKRQEAITLINDIEEDLRRLTLVCDKLEKDVDLYRMDDKEFGLITRDYVLEATSNHIHHFYTGIEQIYERIIVFTSGSKLGGSDFHKQVLKTAHETFLLTSVEENQLLDDLRGFRHVFRKAYGIQMDPIRVMPKAKGICVNWDSIKLKITGFQKQLGEKYNFIAGMS